MKQYRIDPSDCDEWVLFTGVDETFTRDIWNSLDDRIQHSWNSFDKIQYLLHTR